MKEAILIIVKEDFLDIVRGTNGSASIDNVGVLKIGEVFGT